MIAPQLLFVDDDSDSLLSLIRALKTTSLNCVMNAAGNSEAALKLAQKVLPQVSVVDLSLNSTEGVESGFRLMSDLLSLDATCRMIVLTGSGSIENGVRALNAGAANFIEKPADIGHLAALISDGIKQCSLRRAYRDLRIRNIDEFKNLVGESEAILKVKEALKCAAHSNSPLLLSGETGTGKGLCAALIHMQGRRAGAAFVRYQPNFAGPDLVNSDLFGHVKGAFTGATEDRQGLIGKANGGTLFLDEVDELPPALQVALLGVLQDKKFRPLGSTEEQRADFRLICAANGVIEESLASGKLRKDFFHRIAHSTIHLPALRARKEDIKQLAEDILLKLSASENLGLLGIDKAVFSKLINYGWPGNVRELQAVIEGAAYRAKFAGRNYIAESDTIVGTSQAQPAGHEGFHQQMQNFKIKLIKDKLMQTGGNQTQAAKELGLDRTSLRRHLNG